MHDRSSNIARSIVAGREGVTAVRGGVLSTHRYM